MPKIINKTLTKEEEHEKYNRLKGKGFEHPCYLEPPPSNKKPKKPKK